MLQEEEVHIIRDAATGIGAHNHRDHACLQQEEVDIFRVYRHTQV